MACFEAKMLRPDSTSAWAPLKTPLGELIALPQMDFRGSLSREREGRGKDIAKERGRKETEGKENKSGNDGRKERGKEGRGVGCPTKSSPRSPPPVFCPLAIGRESRSQVVFV